MKTIGQIKQEREDKFSALLKEHGVFFAFSTEQFNANKTPLKEGEKYVSMGMGGYIPKGNLDAYLDGSQAIREWYNNEVKTNNVRKDLIIYELNNHEAFYTHSIDTTLEALGSDFSREEVQTIFFEQLRKTA